MSHVSIPTRRAGKTLAAQIMTPATQAEDDGFHTFVMIVRGLATGAVLVGLIEAGRPLAHLIAELIR